MKPWTGVTGVFDFDERGDLKMRTMVLKTVSQGAWTFLGFMGDRRCRVVPMAEGFVNRCG